MTMMTLYCSVVWLTSECFQYGYLSVLFGTTTEVLPIVRPNTMSQRQTWVQPVSTIHWLEMYNDNYYTKKFPLNSKQLKLTYPPNIYISKYLIGLKTA